MSASRRKKFGATVEQSVGLAAHLAALPPGAAVEAQDAMKRVTLVCCQVSKSEYQADTHC